jgi:3',5'-cyclic AMP phosphodiesterase CpdA
VLAAAAVALEARSRPAAPGVVVMAAGDIACDPASADYQAGNGTPSDCQQRATARLVQRQRPDAVLALGDLQYENGALDKFLVSYADSWGRLKDVTHPAIGNHEYLSGYPGYFAYFGAAAGPSRRGYYSFELGAWHVVSLNSNCAEAGGCGVRSPQVAWLRRDLRAHPARCTLAFWHHPHFSSGQHGNDDGGHDPTGAFWSALAAAGADVVLNGHDHDYERFAPQSPTGEPDPRRGIREFVVGTGGRSHYRFHHLQRNSVVRDDRAFGALRLDLRPGSYSWRFVALPGVLLSDAGDGRCH